MADGSLPRVPASTPAATVTRASAPGDTSADLAADLHAALRDGALDLAYQPEYDLQTSAIVAVEALARWRHPELGSVDPELFVATAERAGLIGQLGTWVLHAALADFATWNAAQPGLTVTLRVNVSITQLAEPDYIDEVDAALKRYRVDPRQVCLEITEATPRHSPDAIVESVRAAHAIGVSVAIDDLASGYSTLGMLRAFPVDVVKIDRSLVSDIDRDPKAIAIVTTLVGLASELSLTLVVEGIETQAERETLRRLGCRNGQGFLLSEPLPAPAVRQQLVEHGHRRPRPMP